MKFSGNSLTKESSTTAADGKACRNKLYMDAILAVGCRVRSPRGVQFRRWATSTLTEHLVKGFVMDDERLKDPAWDRFDELLERIRGIRTSEARLDQKLRELRALSKYHDPDSSHARALCATIQNRMLYGVTGRTAAEPILERSDPDRPNMGLTAWKGADRGRPLRKADIGTTRNYLGEAEIREFNLIVEAFLSAAELRAARRRPMRLSG